MTKEIEIRDVWTYNFEEEAAKIREIIQKFPYVAMVCRLAHNIPQTAVKIALKTFQYPYFIKYKIIDYKLG